MHLHIFRPIGGGGGQFLFLNQNTVAGTQRIVSIRRFFKAPKHMFKSTKAYVVDNQNGTVSSFEYPKQIFKLMDKKTFSLLRWNCLLIWTYDSISRDDSNQVAHLQHYYGLTRSK